MDKNDNSNVALSGELIFAATLNLSSAQAIKKPNELRAITHLWSRVWLCYDHGIGGSSDFWATAIFVWCSQSVDTGRTGAKLRWVFLLDFLVYPFFASTTSDRSSRTTTDGSTREIFRHDAQVHRPPPRSRSSSPPDQLRTPG